MKGESKKTIEDPPGFMDSKDEKIGVGKEKNVGIALLSLPWALADRPSHALGVLSGYLLKHGLRCDTFHLNVAIAAGIGYENYMRIAGDWQLGETLYSTLLCPSEKDDLMQRMKNRCKKEGFTKLFPYLEEEFRTQLERVTLKCLKVMNFSRYDIIGFTVSHLQLMASLYISHYIKTKDPNIYIIFGGRGVVGETGRNLLQYCPEVDMVADGDGEETLLHLAGLPKRPGWDQMRSIPNLWMRDKTGSVKKNNSKSKVSLKNIGTPDYSGFNKTVKQHSLPFSNPVYPIEASRGCSWAFRGKPDEVCTPCIFCSLNRARSNYLEKPFIQLWQEIESIQQKYDALDFAFSDTCLSKKYRNDLFKKFADSNKDYTFFSEMRPDFDEDTAILLARAGVSRIQLGVESFSSKLLKRLERGMNLIDTIHCLLLCEEYKIPYQYNIIMHIPGSTAQEIEETLAVIPLLYGLRPPNPVTFFLGRGSRMYKTPMKFDIIPDSLDKAPCPYLPNSLSHARLKEEVTYEPKETNQMTQGWETVAREIDKWREKWETIRRVSTSPMLSFRDRGDSIRVTDLRGRECCIITLEGVVCEVFRACRKGISIERLSERFQHIDRNSMDHILKRLVNEKLVLVEGNRILALPIRSPMPNGIPRGVVHC